MDWCLHYDIEANSVVIYTQKADPDVSSHGVVVIAPNFTLDQDWEAQPSPEYEEELSPLGL